MGRYQKGIVPATLYFYVNDNRRIIGAIHFRHDLFDELKIRGGHIGFGIRHSERNKGYAKMMLRELLDNVDKPVLSPKNIFFLFFIILFAPRSGVQLTFA